MQPPDSSECPANAESPSAVNTDMCGKRGGLFRTRTDILLLGLGACFILCNIVVFFGMETRPNAWLFYFNMRFWSIYTSVLLWTVAIWLALETTNTVKHYLPLIRVAAAVCILLFIYHC